MLRWQYLQRRRLLRVRHMHAAGRHLRWLGWGNLQRRGVWHVRRCWLALLWRHPRDWRVHVTGHDLQQRRVRQVRRSRPGVLPWRKQWRGHVQRRQHCLQREPVRVLRSAGHRLLPRQPVRKPRLLLQQLLPSRKCGLRNQRGYLPGWQVF